MMKIFEADQKRLKSIMLSYEEKKPDLTEREKKERNEVILLLKESYMRFKSAFNEQTNKFEKQNGGFEMMASARGVEAGPGEFTPTKAEISMTGANISRIGGENNETIMAFVEDRNSKIDYLDFDGLLN